MNKINILVLDDTQDQRREVVANLLPTEYLMPTEQRYNLIKSYFNVIEFSRPTEAEGYLMDNNNPNPDLIISDIRFEFADDDDNHGETRGIDFIKFVMTHFPETPTIAITFYGIDRILRRFRNELPHLSLDNIYAVAREETNYTIEDIDSATFGLPFLFKRIANSKLAHNTLNVAQKIALLTAIENDDYLDKNIQTPIQTFEIQHLMLGWASIEKDENQVPKVIFRNSVKDTLREYLDDISFDFIGRMNTQKTKNLIRAYLRHSKHESWVTEIRNGVQEMLRPFFINDWKNLETYEQIEDFMKVGQIIGLTANITLETGEYFDLNRAADIDPDNPDTLERIKNLLRARLVVLTIMHRKSIFFKDIPNVADLAILVVIHKEKLYRDFLNALYYIKIGSRRKEGNLAAINANTRNEATAKKYYKTYLCIKGSLTISQTNVEMMTEDTFIREKLLPEEQSWLHYIDENKIFM